MPKILIVDDTPDNIKLLEFYLEDEEQFELFSATNGAEALKTAREIHPDVILLDVMMPVMDGIEACRQIRADEVLFQVPVILVTAMAGEEDAIRGLEAGADDYVTKPFNGRIVAARTRAAAQRYTVVVENRRLMNQLQEAARVDSLTNLLNRRTFFDVFHHDLSLSARSQKTLACVMLDVDHFKRINDTYGHLAGDQALIHVANCLRQAGRECDAVGRYGGEEFCVVLPNTPLGGATVWADRCRQKIEATPFVWENEEIPLSASFGVTESSLGELEVEAVVNRADLALLEAKNSGRNRVVVFDDAMLAS